MIKRENSYLHVRDTPAPSAAVELEKLGYTVLRKVFSADEVANLAQEIASVYDAIPADHRRQSTAAEREMFRYAMLNKSPLSQQAVAKQGILDVIEPLLGEDCHVIANTAWRNPPHTEDMHNGHYWHIDAGPHIPLPQGTTWPADIPHPVFAIGTHIYLKTCTLKDGPTGVIPGSHLSGSAPPRDQLLNDDLSYQGQSVVPLLAEPGDVGLFVSDVWHRRMPTLPGDQGRFFLQVHYGRRDIAQRLLPTAEINQLSAEAIARAGTAREKSVIGLHQPLFYDG